LRFSRRWLWRMSSSGIWRRIDLVWTDVSEERIASILRVEKSASLEPAWAGGCRLDNFDCWLSLQPPTHASSSIAHFSTLKMEAIRSSETSVHTWSIRRHIPEDGTLQECCSSQSYKIRCSLKLQATRLRIWLQRLRIRCYNVYTVCLNNILYVNLLSYMYVAHIWYGIT
jgi:hypothetical protein